MEEKNQELCNLLITKGELKHQIFNSTLETMQLFKEGAKDFEDYFKNNYAGEHDKISVYFTNKNQYEFQLRFAGDILVFLMHSNVFEFSREHEVMRTQYIKEDKERSYCGMIQIFNFLSDSFKYNRTNDLGYMIGRILINKDMHYYIEGKRELAQVLNNFSTNQLSKESISEILASAIRYTLNFDLLVPDYDTLKIISVNDMLQIEDQNMILKTGKRLGFRFEQDTKEKN
ncbi:MAG: hypothetical protein RR034_03690 [Bacteroidales bacterium]